MNEQENYDVVIVGGGLAGLSCAISLAKQDFRVALFEKEKYPFHKVCGEYISMESYDFLVSLGLSLDEKKLPVIDNLTLSSPKGTVLNHHLILGGFGISRYAIDHELALIARNIGVDLYDGTKVNDIHYESDQNVFKVQTDKEIIISKVVCAAFGKRSNLDVKWKRIFTLEKPNALNNYIAVKYHVQMDHPRNNIALHNFKNGYCGMSAIEDNKTCLCYMTTAQNLNSNGNNIQKMEEEVLYKNPFLKNIFSNATILYEKPIAISQISFEKKEQVNNHILFLGDAAGMIAPLCGNGMSMALHSSKIASTLIVQYLQNKIKRDEMERLYVREWRNMFSRRLHAGRIIQSLFGRVWVTNSVIKILRHFPSLVTGIIRQTHG